MRSCIVVREGNAPLSDEDIQKFNAITCFSDLFGDVMGDAKRLEGEDDDDDEDEEDDDEDVDGEEGEEEEGEEAPEGEGEEEAPSQWTPLSQPPSLIPARLDALFSCQNLHTKQGIISMLNLNHVSAADSLLSQDEQHLFSHFSAVLLVKSAYSH